MFMCKLKIRKTQVLLDILNTDKDPETDPSGPDIKLRIRIRIRSKMFRILNTAKNYDSRAESASDNENSRYGLGSDKKIRRDPDQHHILPGGRWAYFQMYRTVRYLYRTGLWICIIIPYLVMRI